MKNMKKIAIILAAALAAFSFASCNKEEIPASETGNGIVKVNLTVSNPGVDTKAVKTGWVSGDKLNMWFGTRTNASNAGKPDLVVKYDGTSWIKDTEAEVSGNEPAAFGTFKVIYEANNNWNYGNLNNIYSSKNYVCNSMAYQVPLMVFSNEVDYTYNDGVFNANISSWEYLTPIQFVITGLDSTKDPSNYLLKCPQLLTICGAMTGGDGVSVDKGYYYYRQIGVANEDGVAFYFYPDSDTETTTSFDFYLTDLANNTEKRVTLTGHIDNDKTRCQSIKFDASKFTTLSAGVVDGIFYSIGTTGKAAVEPMNYFLGSELYSGAIEIPASFTVGSNTYDVIKIDKYAFQNCTALTSVSLPEGLTTIEPHAFDNTSLTSLNLPATLKQIDESNSVFNGSTNLKITVAEGNSYFFVENELMYKDNKDNTYKLIFVPESKTGDIVLNAKTTSIVSNGTCFNLAADSFEFPAGYRWSPWGVFKGSIKDGFVVKFNNTTYESFTSVFGTTLSSTYMFSSGNMTKIVFSFPSEVSDDDFASLQAWFGTNAKEVVRR